MIHSAKDLVLAPLLIAALAASAAETDSFPVNIQVDAGKQRGSTTNLAFFRGG